MLARLATLFSALLLSATLMAAPRPGDAAPAFRLVDQHGTAHALTDYRGKWLMLYFYPKDDTPGCTEQACSFRDDFARIKMLGAEVVGISVDSAASHAAFAGKHNLPFPLLADADGKVAASYDALTDLVVVKFAKRHTFLIDPQGRIRQRYTDLDTKTYAKTLIADLERLVTAP